MTISSTTRTSTYTGNGATIVYAYTPWRIMDQTHLKVSVQNPTTLAWTLLVLTTDYTVDGVGNGTGGNVTLVSASQAWMTAGFLTNLWPILIERVVPHTQLTNVRGEGPFKPEIHEDEYDLLVSANQQLQSDANRSLKLPLGETSSYALTALPSATDRASKGLGFNSSGEPVALAFTTVGSPTDATYVTLTLNGSLTSERVLTGTSNQITVTDGGAGTTVTLATPQNIHTAATPRFAGLGIGVAASTAAAINMTPTLAGTSQYGAAITLNYSANPTSFAIGFTMNMATPAGAYTTNAAYGYDVNFTAGAGSTTTTLYNFRAGAVNGTIGSAYGYYTDMISASGHFAFYGAGSARSRFGGSVIVGLAALLTTATDGFLYVPTCAGAPTGVPTAFTGSAALIVDSTNHKLYFYDTAWRDAGP